MTFLAKKVTEWGWVSPIPAPGETDETNVRPSADHPVDLSVLQDVPVGFLFNGKQNGDVLLESVSDWLVDNCGITSLGMESKLVASQPAPGDLLARMAARARLIVTGPGD